MKAIILSNNPEPGQLLIKNIGSPTIEKSEVLVAVKAISINPIDLKTRSGKGLYERLKNQDPIILGWDISGVIAESKSDLFAVGDEVFGMVNFPGHGKAYAEFVAAPESHLALKPAEISHEEAAASTLAALTAYQTLVKIAHVKPGDKVLVHAAAGGVGHFAVQIAKHFGAFVVGTSSEKNKDFVIALGADKHIDYHTSQLEECMIDFDIVLDTIGAENIDRSLALMKPGGIIVSIPSGLNETVVEKAKAKGIQGYTHVVSSSGADMKIIAALLASGNIKAHVSKTFSFEDIDISHQHLKTGRTVGKIVVTI